MTKSFYGPTPDMQHSEHLLRDYRAFLGQRNGARFEIRDERMKSFEPSLVRADMNIDSARFNRNYGHFNETDVSEDELALLAFVKINAGEAYGVEVVSKARARQNALPGVAHQVERILTEEERYHTRLLVGAAGHFEGVSVGDAWRPAWPLRILIGSLARLPAPFFHPVLLASEIAGVHTFDWMLRRLKTLFVDQPAVRESMERRLIEVLTDEVGHIAFNRVMVGASGREVARQLAKLVAQMHQVSGRELIALGYGTPDLGTIDRFDFDDLPEEVRRRAFFA
jgi:hypothetical protein